MPTKTQRQYNREAKERKRAFLRAVKAQPCADCRVQFPYYVMQFDHVRGIKRFELSDGDTRSLDALVTEVEKCDVVCANCHATRTHVRRDD